MQALHVDLCKHLLDAPPLSLLLVAKARSDEDLLSAITPHKPLTTHAGISESGHLFGLFLPPHRSPARPTLRALPDDGDLPFSTGFSFSVYTGDLVSHDPDNQLSRAYVAYTETLLYDLFKWTLGSGLTYTVLGNHDSYNRAQDVHHALGGKLATQFSCALATRKLAPRVRSGARTRALSVKHLRIISLNTDTPDNSGMLRFLTDELQEAEDAGDRVWSIGHAVHGERGGRVDGDTEHTPEQNPKRRARRGGRVLNPTAGSAAVLVRGRSTDKSLTRTFAAEGLASR
ncbi:hypothetical protein FB451DRAFT_1401439 [Mycena latifolia]|nr:hypothetical protein FB451DRAFT_1401439 [Mycena latifolia]